MTWREHPALPPRVSRPWLLAAALAYAAALLVGPSLNPDPLPPGEASGVVTLATEVRQGRYGPWALVDYEGGLALADLPDHAEGRRGERARIRGMISPAPGVAAGRPHRGVIRVDEYQVVAPATSPVLVAGNAIRARVRDRLAPLQGGRGLLAGFLIGDVSGVEEADQEAMRRSGLSHFTAVSGSNVALYLLLVYLILGPFGVGPRRRAVIGVLALPPFAAATGFEPSVLRASAMAGIVLGGRIVGLAMEPWQVLSAAVIGLLALDPFLAQSAGFQLSVAATVGVMVGTRWPTARGWVGQALAVSLAAQLAVAPLLVARFGRIPLLSPLVNLVAAPIVGASTMLGGLGVVGPDLFAGVGAGLAEMVLVLARTAAPWPQLGWAGLLSLLAAVIAWMALPRLREWLAVAAAIAIAWSLLTPPRSLPEPGMVVLDVGQGDAVLLAGGNRTHALVDGGPDPLLLLERLHEYGVSSLDLVVLSHVHADHALGLTALPGRIPIGTMWERTELHQTPASKELLSALRRHGIPTHRPAPGEVWRLGELRIVVEAPLRRYASPNDQSIVIIVEGPGRSALLPGDIETVAQAELSHLRADVLKVPHQGAATSDPSWLEGVGAGLAVISVGENDFGHPAAWVVDLLQSAGAVVLRTDQVGDVAVSLAEVGDWRG